jgi:hypothetical protein
MPKIVFSLSEMKAKHALRMAGRVFEATVGDIVDDHTRDAISDLLGKVGKKSPRRTSTTYSGGFGGRAETYAERDERECAERRDAAKRRAEFDRAGRASYEERVKEHREKEAREREHYTYTSARSTGPVYVTNEELLQVSVSVSVDTSKACIIVNACGKTSKALQERIAKHPENMLRYVVSKDVWEVHPSIMPDFKLVLKQFFKEIQVVGVPKAVPSTKFDQLLSKLDKDDKNKMYKLLALKYHTDRGGNHDTMVLVNLVFKEV